MTKLNVNLENSKIVDGDLYITEVFSMSLVKGQKAELDFSSKITFPGLGSMVKYNGEFLRS